MSSSASIDLDDPRTWPEPVAAWVEDWAGRLPRETYAGDLAVPLEEEDRFRALLTTPLIAYHCTRLLDHELEMINAEGLQLLTQELVERRLDAALEHGFLDVAARDSLRASHTFALGGHRHREGQVCLTVGRQVFDETPWGCEPLLSTWGGEGIYMAREDRWPLLQQLGRPAIVVARVDLSASHKVHRTGPPLDRLFVGARIGAQLLFADVFYTTAVPPEDVLAIWQPGHAEYDRHTELPHR